MEQKRKTNVKPSKRPPVPLPSITDGRFTHALNDPIFRRIPRKEKRIDIDKRFQSMFNDKQFKTKYSVDKRGRPIDLSTDEDLKQYYNLVEDDDVDDEEERTSDAEADIIQEEIQDRAEDSESEAGNNDVGGNVDESDIGKRDPTTTKLSKTIKKKLRDDTIDYARGDGFLKEDSSDDSSSSGDEIDDADDTIHAWGELDHDAERTDESTNRLGLCNIDWDRLKAVDLMVLFHSFLPPGGVLKSVNIYTSEYGKQRLADEEVHGPMELRRTESDHEESGSDDDEAGKIGGKEEDEEGGDYQMEKLRKYQLNRLKYFYAVLEFDTVGTAEKIYTECDGMEYESSATRVDLRYIPEGMVFEDEPKDSCDTLPQADKYRPRFFTTTALQQAKVQLTWDETDPLRRELTQKVHNPKEKIDDEDLRAYLASSDSEDEDAVTNGSDAESNVDPVAKYRALLESIETKEKKNDKDVEMEITWGVGLKEKTESLVKKKLEEETASTLTPWEEILEKKKLKKKQKKTQQKLDRKDGNADPDSQGEDEEEVFSDDDVDVDMEDSFFKDEIETNEVMKMGSGKKNRSKEGTKEDKKAVDADNNATLELLLMDDSDNRQHFSLKKIIEAESETKGKKKRKNRKAKEAEKQGLSASQPEDTFQVDVEDSRFGALFSSHLYNVDPSDPNFKKTKGMTAIIQEKQKRRATDCSRRQEGLKPNTETTHDAPNAKISKNEISHLVKSVKRNSQILKNKGNKRK